LDPLSLSFAACSRPRKPRTSPLLDRVRSGPSGACWSASQHLLRLRPGRWSHHRTAALAPLVSRSRSGPPRHRDLCSPLVGKTSRPSESRAASRDVVCRSPPLGSGTPCPQPRILHSEDVADRVDTAASHGPGPASLSASCPGRSGSCLGRAPSCSRTPGIAAASSPVALGYRPR
jgi:hypothetical protein